MNPVTTGKQIGKTLKSAARLKTIVSVFAKHGFRQVAVKINLGRFINDYRNSDNDIQRHSMSERVRMCFEELGPTFVKMGQILATRPDLIPEEYVSEFERLHAQVLPLPFAVVSSILEEELGNNYLDLFSKIEETPLGSASIAQVHSATLKDGSHVVLKVQRPGITQTIDEDLNVLFFLAELLETYLPETKNFRPVTIVEEFFKTLELETNFIVEANNIRRFQLNFAGDPQVKIPKLYMNLITEKVLVMEKLSGEPLSSSKAFEQLNTQSEEIVRLGLRAYLKMVFIDGLFHGDLHAGNFFVLPENRIGLIDFGVVGRLNSRTQLAITNMLLALSKEDYTRLAYEYSELAPFSDQLDVDMFARELSELIAPYYGLTLKDVNLGKILMTSGRIAARHHIRVPAELMLFFKSIVAIEGLGRKITPDFDFLQHALEYSVDIGKHQLDPQRAKAELLGVVRESRNLIYSLPRQLNFLFRKINSPEYAIRLQFSNLALLKNSFEKGFVLMFLGFIISSLIIGSALMTNLKMEMQFYGLPAPAFLGFVLAASFASWGIWVILKK